MSALDKFFWFLDGGFWKCNDCGTMLNASVYPGKNPSEWEQVNSSYPAFYHNGHCRHPDNDNRSNRIIDADMVNRPPHYTYGKYEVLDVIEDWKLNYKLGNVVKYIARADHKGSPVEDLRKALFYLQREIDKRSKDSD